MKTSIIIIIFLVIICLHVSNGKKKLRPGKKPPAKKPPAKKPPAKKPPAKKPPTKKPPPKPLKSDHDEKPRPEGIKECSVSERQSPFYEYTYGFKKVRFIPGVCNRKNWYSAQKDCSRYGNNGKLWEPRSSTEYNAVMNLVKGGSSSLPGWWNAYPHFYIGAKAQSGSSNQANWATPPTSLVWRNLNEHSDDGCVDLYGSVPNWGDHNCNAPMAYVCQYEIKPPCSCSFNGKKYPCDSTISLVPHSCSKMYCDKFGRVRITDYFPGKRQCKCCSYGNSMYPAGYYLASKRLYCCEGKWLRVLGDPNKEIFEEIMEKGKGKDIFQKV